MQLKIAEESGRVASNLSMLCLKIGEKTEALEYANEAANSLIHALCGQKLILGGHW